MFWYAAAGGRGAVRRDPHRVRVRGHHSRVTHEPARQLSAGAQRTVSLSHLLNLYIMDSY